MSNEKTLSQARNELVDKLAAASDASQYRGDMYAPIYDQASTLSNEIKSEIKAILSSGVFPEVTRENAPVLVAYIENAIDSCFDEVLNALIDLQIKSVNNNPSAAIPSCIEVFPYSSEFKSALHKAFSAKLRQDISQDEIDFLERICSDRIDEASEKLYHRLQNESYAPEGVIPQEQALQELSNRKKAIPKTSAVATKVTPGITADNAFLEMGHVIETQKIMISRHRLIANEHNITNPELKKALNGSIPYRTSILLLDDVRSLVEDKAVDNFILACKLEGASSILTEQTSQTAKSLTKIFNENRTKFIYDAQAEPGNNTAKFNDALIQNAAKMSNLVLHLNPVFNEGNQSNENMSSMRYILKFTSLLLLNVNEHYKRSPDNRDSSIELLQMMGKAYDFNTIKSVSDFFSSPAIRNGIAALIKANPQIREKNDFIDALIKFNQFARQYGAEPLAFEDKKINKKISQRQKSPRKEIIFQDLAAELGETFQHASSSVKGTTFNMKLYEWLKAQPSLINPEDIQRGKAPPTVIEFRHEKDNKSTRKIEIRGNDLVLIGFSAQMLESFKEQVLKESNNLQYVNAIDFSTEYSKELVRTKTVLSLSPRLSQTKITLQTSSDNVPKLGRADSTIAPERKTTFTAADKPPQQESENTSTSFNRQQSSSNVERKSLKRQLSGSAVGDRLSKRASRQVTDSPELSQLKRMIGYRLNEISDLDQKTWSDDDKNLVARAEEALSNPGKANTSELKDYNESLISLRDRLKSDYIQSNSESTATAEQVEESTVNDTTSNVSTVDQELDELKSQIENIEFSFNLTSNQDQEEIIQLARDFHGVTNDSGKTEFKIRESTFTIDNTANGLEVKVSYPTGEPNTVVNYVTGKFPNAIGTIKAVNPDNEKFIQDTTTVFVNANQDEFSARSRIGQLAESLQRFDEKPIIQGEKISTVTFANYTDELKRLKGRIDSIVSRSLNTEEKEMVNALVDQYNSLLKIHRENGKESNIYGINQEAIREAKSLVTALHYSVNEYSLAEIENVQATTAKVDTLATEIVKDVEAKAKAEIERDIKAELEAETMVSNIYQEADSEIAAETKQVDDAKSETKIDEKVKLKTETPKESTLVENVASRLQKYGQLNLSPINQVFLKAELQNMRMLKSMEHSQQPLESTDAFADRIAASVMKDVYNKSSTVVENLNRSLEHLQNDTSITQSEKNQAYAKIDSLLDFQDIASDDIPLINRLAGSYNTPDDLTQVIHELSGELLILSETPSNEELEQVSAEAQAIRKDEDEIFAPDIPTEDQEQEQVRAEFNRINAEEEKALEEAVQKNLQDASMQPEMKAINRVLLLRELQNVSALTELKAPVANTSESNETKVKAIVDTVLARVDAHANELLNKITDSEDIDALSKTGDTSINSTQEQDLGHLVDFYQEMEIPVTGTNEVNIDSDEDQDETHLGEDKAVSEKSTIIGQSQGGDEMPNLAENQNGPGYVPGADTTAQKPYESMASAEEDTESSASASASPRPVQVRKSTTSATPAQSKDAIIVLQSAPRSWLQSKELSTVTFNVKPNSLQSDAVTEWINTPGTTSIPTATGEKYTFPKGAELEVIRGRESKFIARGFTPEMLASLKSAISVSGPPSNIQLNIASKSQHDLAQKYLNFTPKEVIKNKHIGRLNSIPYFAGYFWNKLKSIVTGTNKSTEPATTRTEREETLSVNEGQRVSTKPTISPIQSQDRDAIEMSELKSKSDTTALQKAPPVAQNTQKPNIEKVTTQVAAQSNTNSDTTISQKTPKNTQIPITENATTQVATQSNSTNAAPNITSRPRTKSLSENITVRLMVSIKIEENNEPKDISAKLTEHLKKSGISLPESDSPQLDATISIPNGNGLKKQMTIKVDDAGQVTISCMAPDAAQRKFMIEAMGSAISQDDRKQVKVTVTSYPGREMTQKIKLIDELQKAGYEPNPPEQRKGRSFTM